MQILGVAFSYDFGFNNWELDVICLLHYCFCQKIVGEGSPPTPIPAGAIPDHDTIPHHTTPTVYGRSKVWSRKRRKLAALITQSQLFGEVTWPKLVNDVIDQLLLHKKCIGLSLCASQPAIFFMSNKQECPIWVAFPYIFYSETTSDQMFFF